MLLTLQYSFCRAGVHQQESEQLTLAAVGQDAAAVSLYRLRPRPVSGTPQASCLSLQVALHHLQAEHSGRRNQSRQRRSWHSLAPCSSQQAKLHTACACACSSLSGKTRPSFWQQVTASHESGPLTSWFESVLSLTSVQVTRAAIWQFGTVQHAPAWPALASSRSLLLRLQPLRQGRVCCLVSGVAPSSNVSLTCVAWPAEILVSSASTAMALVHYDAAGRTLKLVKRLALSQAGCDQVSLATSGLASSKQASRLLSWPVLSRWL